MLFFHFRPFEYASQHVYHQRIFCLSDCLLIGDGGREMGSPIRRLSHTLISDSFIGTKI